MNTDEEILSKLSQTSLTCTLHDNGQVFALDNVSITKSAIPVKKPTTRGGAYFTDTTVYKVKATTHDLTIIKLLPKLMLGPNTEFGSLEIKTNLEINGMKKEITLIAHVANTMNTKTLVELNLIVDNVSIR
jgi:hypothetical protein